MPFSPPPTGQGLIEELATLDRAVWEHVQGVLARCDGKKKTAARVLGVSRSRLYRMLELPRPPR